MLWALRKQCHEPDTLTAGRVGTMTGLCDKTLTGPLTGPYGRAPTGPDRALTGPVWLTHKAGFYSTQLLTICVDSLN